jgi:Flp pilus assembly protein TadD
MVRFFGVPVTPKDGTAMGDDTDQQMEALLAGGDFQGAMADGRAAMPQPEDAAFWRCLGEAALGMGARAEARQYFVKAAVSPQQRAIIWERHRATLLAGLQAALTGKVPAVATIEAEFILALRPADVAVIRLLANYFLSVRNMPDKALAAAGTVSDIETELEPSALADLRGLKAGLLFAMGRHQEALVAARESVAAMPCWPAQRHHHLAKVLEALGRDREAELVRSWALRHDEYNAWIEEGMALKPEIPPDVDHPVPSPLLWRKVMSPVLWKDMAVLGISLFLLAKAAGN